MYYYQTFNQIKYTINNFKYKELQDFLNYGVEKINSN